MAKYILQRVFSMLLTLFFISSITFFLMHAIPGGPFTREKPLPPSIVESLNKKYHLDEPVWKQYGRYMTDLLRGDLGPSFIHKNRTVNEMIGTTFPVTARIALPAILLTLLVGLPMGVFAALKQNKVQDYSIMLFTTLGITIPSFIMAALITYVFAVKLNWFPVVSSSLKEWKAFVLPVFALTCFSTSFIVRLMRSSMLDVIGQDYICTARAKGISESKVILKHAMKNAVIPVITYVGPMLAGLLTGSFVIEKMFTIPGIGQLFVSSISNRDYTMIMGTTIFYAVLLVFMNFVVDIAYGLIDPRMRMGSGKGA